MRGGSRRGSYFFVLDAFIASAILVFTIVLVFSLFLSSRGTNQSFTYASDYLSFLSTTELRDYQSPVVDELVASGNITDTRKTIAQQLLTFYNESGGEPGSELHDAWLLLNESADLLPQDVAFNVSLHGSSWNYTLYNRSVDGLYDGRTHLAVRSVEYAMINRASIFGPLILEVDVWR